MRGCGYSLVHSWLTPRELGHPTQGRVGQCSLCQELRGGRQREDACGVLSPGPGLELHWKFLDLCSPAFSFAQGGPRCLFRGGLGPSQPGLFPLSAVTSPLPYFQDSLLLPCFLLLPWQMGTRPEEVTGPRGHRAGREPCLAWGGHKTCTSDQASA